VAIDELRLGGEFQELPEERASLLDWTSDDVRGVRAEVQRFPARRSMRTHQRLLDRRHGGPLGVGELVVADEPSRVDEAVLGDERLEPALAIRGQRIPCAAQIGVLGLAALGRDLAAGQERGHGRDPLEGAVAVPEAVAGIVDGALVVGIEDAVALVHIGDVGDARVVDAALTVLAEADLERAEALAEGDLLVVGEYLLGEDHHGVAVEGIAYLAEVALVQRLREIESAQSRDEVSLNGRDQDPHVRPPLP